MGHYHNPSLPTLNNLKWQIDAANFRSYPGSGLIIYDLNTNNKNDLTSTASVTFTGVGSTSYFTYSGSSQYSNNTSVVSGVLVQGPITINVIFNPNSISTTQNVIAIYAGASNSVQIGYRSDTSTGAIWKNGGTALLTFPMAGLGTVMHLAYTCDGANNSRVYINGALWTSGTVATNTGTATHYALGSFYTGGGEYFNGRIYYASIYDQVHTADEIAQTYHALKRRWGYSGVGTFVSGINPSGDPGQGGLQGGQ